MTLTIQLPPEAELQLRERAAREGQGQEAVAASVLAEALAWEAQDQAEAVKGVRLGEQAAAEGRERPLAEFLAEQRVKHGFSPDWPHEDTDAQDARHAA